MGARESHLLGNGTEDDTSVLRVILAPPWQDRLAALDVLLQSHQQQSCHKGLGVVARAFWGPVQSPSICQAGHFKTRPLLLNATPYLTPLCHPQSSSTTPSLHPPPACTFLVRQSMNLDKREHQSYHQETVCGTSGLQQGYH